MKNIIKNPQNQVVFLFLIALAILLFMQLIPPDIKIAGYTTKEFDLFMDVRPDSISQPQINSFENNDSTNINQDTLK